MRIGEVFNMDVVANACAIWSWVVIAENIEWTTKAKNGFHHQWHQVLRH